MRWNKPKNREVKIKRKFAIFPIRINDEIRWLEWVVIKYMYHNGDICRDWKTNQLYRLYGWCKEEFVDDDKQ